MSYLDVPRLHFSGTFIANPSTVNNVPTNYDPANQSNLDPQWNPDGNAFWKFTDCAVQTAVTSDGTVWNASNPEPVVNATLASTDTPTPAKLVDLDTEQQMVSQIWGLQIKVTAPATGDYFVGNFRPISFNDIWARVPNGQQDWMFSAFFQSVLDDVQWCDRLASPFLRELQTRSPRQLSIKFVVDNYQDVQGQQAFSQGRVVGTIGPAQVDEPPNFVLGRQLRPVGFNPSPNTAFNGTPLYFGYARVDSARSRLLVDLGNSVPTQADDSTSPPSQLLSAPPLDVGTLSVAVIPPQGGSPEVLGDFDYSLDAYRATAGVREFKLTPQQLAALTTAPNSLIGVVQTDAPTAPPGAPTAPTVLLQESPTGAYINATQPAYIKNPGATSPVFRMAPGDVAAVELVALRFGQPAAGETIVLDFDNDMLVIQEPPPASPPASFPDYTVGVPVSALKFPRCVTTDARGRACFELVAGDPRNPRAVIDGQVYGVGYRWWPDNQYGFPSNPNTFLSVLVFDSFRKPPTWTNIEPFMHQYAWLYPFMENRFKMDDPAYIRQNIALLRRYLLFPYTDPRHMPVTRDLSPDKRRTLIRWLDNGAPADGSPKRGK